MKYIKKPIEVEAIQYTGENAKEIAIFGGFNETDKKIIRFIKKTWSVGQWFVKGELEKKRNMPNEEFQEQYQAVEE